MRSDPIDELANPRSRICTMRFRFQYSLQTLFIAVLVCSVFLGWPSRIWLMARKQKAAVEVIQAQGNSWQVKYDFEQEGHSSPPHIPSFLVSALGQDCFSNIVHVSKSGSQRNYGRDEELNLVKGFTHLESLQLFKPSISTSGLLTIGSRDLHSLSIIFADFSGEGLSRLNCSSRLRDLTLIGCGISDDGIAEIAKLQSLADLDLRTGNVPFGHCGVPARFHEDSLSQLVQLKELKSLKLGGVELTDTGIGHVAKLTTLESLMISLRGGVTLEGLRQLRTLVNLQQIQIDGSIPYKIKPGSFKQMLESIGVQHHLTEELERGIHEEYTRPREAN